VKKFIFSERIKSSYGGLESAGKLQVKNQVLF